MKRCLQTWGTHNCIFFCRGAASYFDAQNCVFNVDGTWRKKRERERPKKGCFSMLFYIRIPRCQFLGVSRHVDPVCSPEQDPCTEILWILVKRTCEFLSLKHIRTEIQRNDFTRLPPHFLGSPCWRVEAWGPETSSPAFFSQEFSRATWMKWAYSKRSIA